MEQLSLEINLLPKPRNMRHFIAASAVRRVREAAELATWQASDSPPLFCKGCKCWRDRLDFASYLFEQKRYWHTRCNHCRSVRYMQSANCAEKRTFLDGLRNKPCEACGHKFAPEVMRFWCKNGRPKFSLNQAWSGRSLSSIIVEAKRHITVCANCFIIKASTSLRTRRPKRSKLAGLCPELAKLAVYSPDLESINNLQTCKT